MDIPPLTTGDDTSAPPFEWSELFDFTIDDPFFSNLDPVVDPTPDPHPSPAPNDRVRKRDPRMVCENFLAGLVPCACPELDALMEEEEEGEDGVTPSKKRARMGRTPGVARCQVPGCGVDITELKGYHRRHRVCLGCASAASVLIDGESKRYCQQCGKFHILSDFDEGKRSCRRKLERHNNRRRRKPADTTVALEKDAVGDLQTEDVSSDGEVGKENASSTSQIAEREDSKDGTLSNLCSAPECQNIDSDSMTFTQVDRVLENSKQDLSPPSCDNKSAYSSVCPTGRISFKLYDWNPAEFPRRLRHQIFQWLSSMPVELEGYIRPGCTIMTAFVSMPQFMWVKLFEDPVSYVQSSVGPGGMLSGRGTALVYLNDMTFRVVKDGASVIKLEVALQAPKLHYVYPPCFEAGKPMDFIACGSNLLQPKFRSLISFAGKYVAHDYYVAFPGERGEKESAVDFDRQFFRIYVPHTEPSFFGPAFIEVENECGLSNFIPVLIGDEHVCSEIHMIHQKYDCSNCYKNAKIPPSGSSQGPCQVPCSRQTAFSEFMLDVAWLLKWPSPEKFHHVLTSSHIQRLNYLLNFLIRNKSTSILEKILQSLQIVLDEIESSDVATAPDLNRRLFKEYINRAEDFLKQGVLKDGYARKSLLEGHRYLSRFPADDLLSTHQHVCQVVDTRDHTKSTFVDCLESRGKAETVSLLNVDNSREWQEKSYSLMFSKRFVISRPFFYMIAAIAVCFGVCAVVFHPTKVSKFAVTIKRCVFDSSSNL